MKKTIPGHSLKYERENQYRKEYSYGPFTVHKHYDKEFNLHNYSIFSPASHVIATFLSLVELNERELQVMTETKLIDDGWLIY